MAKDDLHSDGNCPECCQENQGSESTASYECCSCCSCSCSDEQTDSPNESQLVTSIEQQKKDLLSNMSIRRTNQEPASIQQVLQFVEALSHSKDFLRRYNLLDDFCLDCLIREPLCCSDGNRERHQESNESSCSDCNSSADGVSSQNCSECTKSSKPLVSSRHKAEARRERRRRRRQRRGRHLPRTSSDRVTPLTRRQSQPHSDRPSRGRCTSTPSRLRPSNCDECCTPTPSVHASHRNNCEDCGTSASNAHAFRATNCEQCCPSTSITTSHVKNCGENVTSTSSSSNSCGDTSSLSLKSCHNKDTNASDQVRSDETKPCAVPVCAGYSPEHKVTPKRNRQAHKNSDKVCGLSSSSKSTRANRKLDKKQHRKREPTPERSKSSSCSCSGCGTSSESSEESCRDCKPQSSKKTRSKKK